MKAQMRITALLGAGALSLMFIGCSLKTPGAPVWTVEATLPFSQKVYRMGDLVTDSVKMADQGWGLRINPADSLLVFEAMDSLEYQSIKDRIKYEASDVGQYSNAIGAIHIEQPLPDADTVNISEANPLLQPGYNGPVAPFSMDEAVDTLAFEVFRWVRVNTGSMNLTIVNGFPFEMRNLAIELENIEDGSSLGTVIFQQPIPANGSATESLNLAGVLMYDQVRMTANGSSPGSATPVSISGNEKLQLVLGITRTDADSAYAQIEAQEFSNPDVLALDNANRIVEARIKDGTAFFVLRNTTPFQLTSDMVFENFYDSTNTPIQKRISLAPHGVSRIEQISLRGSRVVMDLNAQGIRVSNVVSVEDTRETRYNGETYQVIKGDQGVEIQYWTDELTLGRFEGILDSITVDIPPTITAVEIPQGLDSLNFTRDTVFIFIDNETTMPLKGNFSLRAVNSRNGASITLPIPLDLLPGQNSTTLPNADRLTSVLPDSIILEGWAGLGQKFFPNQGVGIVSEDDGFAGAYLIRSALKFTIGNTRILTEPSEMDSLDIGVQSVDLRVHLINSIPLSGIVRILVGNDTTAMDTVIQVDIPRGDIVNRRSAAAAETTYTVGLDSAELAIMKRSPVFTRQLMTFQSSNGDTAWIYPQDSLAVQASATVRVTIDPNDGGN